MRRRVFVGGWLVLILLSAVLLAQAQPTMPQKDIPANTPPEIKAAILELYSPDAETRGKAAELLGSYGPKATPAIPFLIALLGDFTSFEEDCCPSSPGEKAATALGQIGEPALQALQAALSSKDPKVFGSNYHYAHTKK